MNLLRLFYLSILITSRQSLEPTERIVQAGKKKLVLDHVIVQKMDDEEGGGDVRSILTYGALALFDETAAAREITCTL